MRRDSLVPSAPADTLDIYCFRAVLLPMTVVPLAGPSSPSFPTMLVGTSFDGGEPPADERCGLFRLVFMQRCRLPGRDDYYYRLKERGRTPEGGLFTTPTKSQRSSSLSPAPSSPSPSPPPSPSKPSSRKGRGKGGSLSQQAAARARARRKARRAELEAMKAEQRARRPSMDLPPTPDPDPNTEMDTEADPPSPTNGGPSAAMRPGVERAGLHGVPDRDGPVRPGGPVQEDEDAGADRPLGPDPTPSWSMQQALRRLGCEKVEPGYLMLLARMAVGVGGPSVLRTWRDIMSRWRARGRLFDLPDESFRMLPERGMSDEGELSSRFATAWRVWGEWDTVDAVRTVAYRFRLAEVSLWYKRLQQDPPSSCRPNGRAQSAAKARLFQLCLGREWAGPRRDSSHRRFDKFLSHGNRWRLIRESLGPGGLALLPVDRGSRVAIERMNEVTFDCWLQLVHAHSGPGIELGRMLEPVLTRGLLGQSAPEWPVALDVVSPSEHDVPDDRSSEAADESWPPPSSLPDTQSPGEECGSGRSEVAVPHSPTPTGEGAPWSGRVVHSTPPGSVVPVTQYSDPTMCPTPVYNRPPSPTSSDLYGSAFDEDLHEMHSQSQRGAGRDTSYDQGPGDDRVGYPGDEMGLFGLPIL